MADPFADFLPALPPSQDLRGFGWARFTLVLFGLGGVISSFVCIGIPMVYAVVLAWRALDRAEEYSRSGDAGAATESAKGFLASVKWLVIGQLVLMVGAFVLMVVAVVGLTALGNSLGENFQ